MNTSKLPEWISKKIEEYFGFDVCAFPETLYSIIQFWIADVAYVVGGNAILTETAFVVAKRFNSDSIFCFRITEEKFEVSNILY